MTLTLPSAPFRLRDFAFSIRLTLTAFVLMIGVGFLMALGNIYYRHQLADGKPGFTLDDMLIIYHGKEVTVETLVAASVAKSRMMEMVEPGGDMRKNLEKGGEEAIESLIPWLEGGALEAAFDVPPSAHPSYPTPKSVISHYCLRCHNAEGGEKEDTPYGPDLFTVEYALVNVVAQPPPLDPNAPPPVVKTTKTMGPQSISHLVLITHAHMLSIPIFTLILFVLFQGTEVPSRWRGLIGPMPMLAVIADFSGWWLARESVTFVYLLSVSGAIYGLALAVQINSILHGMWLAKPTLKGPAKSRREEPKQVPGHLGQ